MTLRSSGGYDPQRSRRPVVLHDCRGTGAHAWSWHVWWLFLAALIASVGAR
jgi:hypothetical protein